MLKRYLVTLMAALSLTTPAFAVLNINPTFTDGAGQTWTADRMGVVNQAISEWEAIFAVDAQANGQTVNVEFDFTTGESYLGLWSSEGSTIARTNPPVNPEGLLRPWDTDVTMPNGSYTRGNMTQTISLNADLFTGANYVWFDPTPLDGSDQPFEGWDALSVMRHEIGHMMGFTTLYGVIPAGTSSVVSDWELQVSTVGPATMFDAGGLDLELAASDNLGHFANSVTDDLMLVAIPNGQRRFISDNDIAALETAYDYDLVPEPATMSLLLFGGMAMLRRRKK